MHSFIALPVALIPKGTIRAFNFGDNRFSNGKEYLLIDGYDSDGNLVHSDSNVLMWAGNSDVLLKRILSESITYTREQMKQLHNDINSIWYCEGVL